MKILSILGTRPEAIKMAPVLHELKRRARRCNLRSIICATAQHRQMLDQTLAAFHIVPDIDLELMLPNQTLASLSARALMAVTEVLDHHRPDLVLVQGDTTSAMIASMAAFYAKIPVGHIEAGLRTHDSHSPFPEEANRRIITALADYHFAPTSVAVNHLRREGIREERVFLTGNPGIDALLWITNRQPSVFATRLITQLGLEENAGKSKTILVTAHRRENHGAHLEDICFALRSIVSRNHDVQIVFPVHLNPNVRGPALRILGARDRIHLVDPLPYEVFAHLTRRVHFLMTDSGGLQEEAPALGKPVLVLRDDTERPEGVEVGCAKLIGTESARVVAEAERLLRDDLEYLRMSRALCPYGDGRASQRIADVISGRPGLPFVPLYEPILPTYLSPASNPLQN